MQDLVPPLLALVAASAEVNAARCASVDSQGMTVSRHSLASLAGLSRVGEGTSAVLAWAAGAPCLACLSGSLLSAWLVHICSGKHC